jgi:SAM-dependent methyltransferase
MKRRRRDRELEAGSLAHYEDPLYYSATYASRVEDIAYYVDLAKRHRGPVLEYGIGNGRIALPVARSGVEVVGVDHSPPMLRDLRARLSVEPPDVRKRVRAVRGDMKRVRVEGAFPLVLCTFNTALHLYTRRDVERFLARVRQHLTPRGRFVVDLSIPYVVDLARDANHPFHVPRFRHPSSGDVVRNRERFDYDPISQVLFVAMEFEPVQRPEGSWMTPLAHRQFFPQEWEALLHYNGLDVIRVDGDFQGGPLTPQSDVMVWHARRAR